MDSGCYYEAIIKKTAATQNAPCADMQLRSYLTGVVACFIRGPEFSMWKIPKCRGTVTGFLSPLSKISPVAP